MAWCNANKDRIDRLSYVWHKPSVWEGQSGFYDNSHMAAYDRNGVALHCTRWSWSKPQNMADIDRIAIRLRLLLGLE